MAKLSGENARRLDEARARVAVIRESLPSVVDPASISYTSKVPYKLLVFREAVLWRTEELARSSCDLIESGDYCSAIITTRAVMENMAALIYVADFLASQIKSLDPKADDRVMALLMGHKNWDEMPQAVNVLTMLNKAAKVEPKITEVYADLSEYSHPNWAGTSGLFSKHDPEEVLTNFAAYPRGVDRPAAVALTALVGSLKLLVYAYNTTADLLPKFIDACEEDLQNRS